MLKMPGNEVTDFTIAFLFQVHWNFLFYPVDEINVGCAYTHYHQNTLMIMVFASVSCKYVIVKFKMLKLVVYNTDKFCI
jgi:hypothetical protein